MAVSFVEETGVPAKLEKTTDVYKLLTNFII
jgi:hypothetical protein